MRKQVMMLAVFSALVMLQPAGVLAGKVIPDDLPRPDDTAPAKDKPVKVYILSGQSNMVGFGRVTGAAPVYPSIYLSAAPSVMPCRMPVGDANKKHSALLPHGLYKDGKGGDAGARAYVYKGTHDPSADFVSMKPMNQVDVALGTVTANLPAVDGPHTVVVKAFIEVPISGAHMVHAGYGDSTYAVVELDGEEVYRRDIGGKPELTKVTLESGRRYPVTITYFKGGSAAFWMELVDLKGKGDLEALVKHDGMLGWLMDDAAGWTVRNDVVLCESYLDKNKFKGGRNTPLTATANGKHIGPELGFGYVMGTIHDEPVLLIKSTIGNRSLAWDCLPPGSERYEVDGMIYAGYKDPQSKWEKGTEPKPGGWYAGKQYDEFTKAIHGVLDNFDSLYPQYKDQGYEIAGFVWWQGHKDQNDVHASRYEQNLINLIKAWRKEFKAPDAKWVLATIAFGGWDLGEPGLTIANAQLAVDGDSGRHPELKGNVKTIEARGFWRTQAESPTGTGYHYNHNAETYYLVGDALGRAMAELQGAAVEPGPVAARGPMPPKEWSAEPTLAEAAEMIYTDAFISPWARDDAEPTKEQMTAMADALKPMIVGSLIPAFIRAAPGIPAYRRGGRSLMPIVTGQLSERQKKRWRGNLGSQLDILIRYYNAAGVHDYDWKPFGPEMRTGEWYYFSFDPPEKQDKAKSDRNREISYPEGMENWYTVDFDAAAAGWERGTSPFGQKDGKPLGTMWEHEVLLMRQTFDIPELQEDHRYRLIVGESMRAFSGEGYSIYVNGKLFTEEKGGHYKRGGLRGEYILDDFLPDLKSGKVTIAVKGFLRYTGHRNKEAPPHGHLSVWLEQMKLPAAVLELANQE